MSEKVLSKYHGFIAIAAPPVFLPKQVVKVVCHAIYCVDLLFINSYEIIV